MKIKQLKTLDDWYVLMIGIILYFLCLLSFWLVFQYMEHLIPYTESISENDRWLIFKSHIDVSLWETEQGIFAINIDSGEIVQLSRLDEEIDIPLYDYCKDNMNQRFIFSIDNEF